MHSLETEWQLEPLQVREAIRRMVMPTQKTENAGKLTSPTVSIDSGEGSTFAWADIEEVLSDEWEIAGLAMTTEAMRALIAGDETI
jgi:4-oxalocrotonate tautomerase